jgi:hypothetical protein
MPKKQTKSEETTSNGIKKTTEKSKKSKAIYMGKKKTMKCRITKKIFIRNQNRIGGKELSQTETNSSFYSKLQLPPSPIQFSITNYLKSSLNKITSDPQNFESLGHLCDKLGKNGGNGIFKIHSTVTAKLVTTIDLYMQRLFSKVKYLISLCVPSQKISEVSTGMINYETKSNKTLLPSILFNAFVMTWNDSYGPTEQSTFDSVSSAFAVINEMQKWKSDKKKTKSEKDKTKLTQKIDNLKEAFKSELEKQCSTKLFSGEGFVGTLKRYQIERQSSSIKYLMEVIIRAFLDEIIRKSINVIIVHKTSSIDERVISFCLSTCGFEENL